jgi:hypothetical protein
MRVIRTVLLRLDDKAKNMEPIDEMVPAKNTVLMTFKLSKSDMAAREPIAAPVRSKK